MPRIISSSRAPSSPSALQVGKWVKGNGVPSLANGHIYVVEFWATWCGQCKCSRIERALVRSAHARHFLDLASRGRFEVQDREELDDFTEEHSNLSTAIQWSLDTENV